jgi:anti-sigma factor RsiW
MRCAVVASRIPSRDAQTQPLVPYILSVVNQNDHPRDEEIAAFLDGGLSAADRAIVSRHLAECDDCRALLGPTPERSSIHLTTTSHNRRLRIGRPALAGVAAAAVLVMTISSLRSRRPVGGVDDVRGDSAQTIETPVLSVRSPADGSRVRVDTLALRWASAGADATYDVSIVDAAGDEVWSLRVATTDVSLPAEIRSRLRPGATYYWRADALLPDLRTASTGPQGFVLLER